MISAQQALERLREGNRRFAAGTRSDDMMPSPERRAELAVRQDPVAIVLGCSDSRVPVEIVFDQGLGDLFVIRIAGNIVASSQLGSVEFAVAHFGTPLVVVLGHSACGAVGAALQELEQPQQGDSSFLSSLVERVRPSVERFLGTEPQPDRDHDALMRFAVRANVEVSVDQLRHGSAVLEKSIRDGDLLVVGAEYSLQTGLVEFFDGTPG